MASDEYGKGKEDLQEDNRTDSGIESFKSIPSTKDDQLLTTTRDSTSLCSETRDKFANANITEERLDSAYSSSSLTAVSLSEIVEDLTIGSTPQEHEGELWENGLTTITEDGDTILHLAIIHEDEDFALQLIHLFPKDVLNIQNNLYQTPLHLATYLSLPLLVQRLVGKGASLELQDQEGNTPLHVACQQGHTDCATEMTREVSPSKLAPVLETQNWRGLTCLHLAILKRQHRLIKLLMKKDANLNIQEGTSGKTALHLAVELRDIDSVALLLKKGANVDAAMFNGCTPLHLAVGRQDSPTAELLCRSGADRMLRNMEGETALDLAGSDVDIVAFSPFDDILISGRSVGVQF